MAKVNQKEYAELRGITPSAVNQKIKNGMPIGGDGLLNTANCFEWELQRVADNPQAARIRKDNAQAEKTEIEVEVLKGNLIPKDISVSLWTNAIMHFRANLIQLPIKLAEIAVTGKSLEEIESHTREEIFSALDYLAQGNDFPETQINLDEYERPEISNH